MRCGEMSKVLKMACQGKKCITVKGKGGKRVLFIIKGSGFAQVLMSVSKEVICSQ